MSSTLTRKVAGLVAVAAAAAAVAIAAPAAGASTLSVSTARTLAHRLVVKQRQKRPLLFARLGHAVRHSSQRIDFGYSDRSTDNVLCTARIVVVQSGSSRHADLTGARCNGISSEVLGYESAARRLARYVADHASALRRSLRRYKRSLATCDQVAVPQSRAKDVDLLVAAGGTHALYAPIRSRLDTFSNDLHAVHATNPRLTRGLDAWDKALALVDELPAAAADPCAAVKRWADDNYSSDTAPADFGELKVEQKQLADEVTVLDQTAHYLFERGVLTRPAAAFSPSGLVAIAER